MAYDGKLLARARAQLDSQRAANRDEQQRRQDEVYARVPEIRRIDQTLRAHMAALVRLTIGRGPDMAEKLAALREENLDLQMRRAELLTASGFGADYLDEIVSCPKCRDSGIFEGGVCTCLDRLYNAELTKELGTLMRRGDESFARFDLTLYPDTPDSATGLVARDVMRRVSSACQRYAESFSPASRNLLFQGGTGLGKTYLSACIARVVAGRGFSVCYETAAAALDNYERAKFSRDSEEGEAAATRIRRMESCDLMILDDLGTEMVTPMSQSALYTLINNRLVGGKKTIISTNLSDDELTKKYTPQISSRILGEFQCFPFAGRDIRQLKK
ncbi:MAG: ATP-binding protein [Oscillospiraceae bacterium]|nr:ATP-binding protein [Oscillospiraceae bacterium]